MDGLSIRYNELAAFAGEYKESNYKNTLHS